MAQLQIQDELFNADELEDLQSVLLANYQERFEKSVYVFKEEAEIPEENIPDYKMRGKLQGEIFTETEINEKAMIYEQIQQKKHDDENHQAHQSADLIRYENPKNDNQLLLNYQFDYLKNDDQEAWGKLIELSFVVTKRLIWQWLKKHKDVYLDDISQEEKVSDAVHYVLRRYKKNIGWYAKDNYIGALKSGVIHVMKYCTTIEKNTIFVEDVNKCIKQQYEQKKD